MSNELRPGTRRHGNLVDFDAETPQVNVVLEMSDQGISVSIPWADSTSHYARWFVDHESAFLGPDVQPVPVPKILQFYDAEGAVLLVGCWARGYHTSVFGPGSGTVWAHNAVIGVRENIDFREVEGVRSEVTGLQTWLGIRSVDGVQEYSQAGGSVFRITARAAERVEVLPDGRLDLIPSWSRTATEDSATFTDLIFCESRSTEPVDWNTLTKPHLALRDLLVLSQWRAEDSKVTAVRRTDDDYQMQSGEAVKQWRDVVPGRVQDVPDVPQFRRHLIQFSEIGLDGLRKWLQVRDEFARALDPIISARRLQSVLPVTMMAQIGPGIEALGYLLMLRDGMAEPAAARANLEKRFRRVLTEVVDVIPFDGEEWVTGTVAAYNGLKHANRAEPEEIELINRSQETILAIRVWAALEIGTPAGELKQRVLGDPQAHPYELIQ